MSNSPVAPDGCPQGELTITELVEVAAAFRFADAPDTTFHATKYAMRELARRHQH